MRQHGIVVNAGVLAVGAVVAVMSGILRADQNDDRRLVRQSPGGERRVALVIGNDTYPDAPLRNARNDAREMAKALEELHFTVTKVEDAPREALVDALAAFADQLQPGDVALFFYAGHGVQVGQENYLVPVDFRGQSATAARFNLVKVSEVQQTLERARVSMLVLDACRNNPFTGARGGGGLAAMTAARGGLIAFATGSGRTASDNAAAANGLFTAELLKALRMPGLTVQDVFRHVREGVDAASRGTQRPALYEDVVGELVLRPTATPAAMAAAPSAPPAALVSPPDSTPGTTAPYPHVVVAANGRLRPAPGYTWETSELNDYRVRWVPGSEHGEAPHVLAGTREGIWVPAPGYAWVNDDADDLRVVPKGGQSSETASQANGARAAASVVHDHDGMFLLFFTRDDPEAWNKAFCVGTLYITDAAIGYKSKTGTHDWQAPLSALKEAKQNTFVGSEIGAFHVELAAGPNYNFVLVNPELQPQPAEPMLNAILAAAAQARKAP